MSNWDAVILACVTKRPMTFVAKKELFDVPVLRAFLKALGVEPIDRGKSDLLALKTILSILKDGNSIFMFPQGTRHPGKNPEGTEVKCGISMMVKHTKATVLPIGIYTKDYKIKPFRKVYVNIGKAMSCESLQIADSSREEYERVAGDIFGCICSLCKESEEKSNGTK
jgi:1-acyl-sn-glycerol-3-phosphate acyltransferase